MRTRILGTVAAPVPLEVPVVNWYLAPSLDVLREEVDARWPGRDRTSDGTVGDLAHQQRESDHNPNARGSVNAWDVDRDGVDVAEILAAFQRHPSAHYWIFNRQIADRDTGWQRRPYTGDNPHTAHAHLSIRQTLEAERDTRAWGLLEDDMTPLQAKQLKAVDARLAALVSGALEVTTSWSDVNPTGKEPIVPNVRIRALEERAAAQAARIEALATAEAARDGQDAQRDAQALAILTELRGMVDGGAEAEAIVRRMGELLSA